MWTDTAAGAPDAPYRAYGGGMERPVLVYDADCAFCARCLAFGRRRLRWMPPAVGYQFADLPDLGLTLEQTEQAIVLIDLGGRRHRGHRAVAAILRRQPQRWIRAVGTLIGVPPLSWLAAGVYRWVALNRHRLPGGTAACQLPR